jgi:hypothetical protein
MIQGTTHRRSNPLSRITLSCERKREENQKMHGEYNVGIEMDSKGYKILD